MQDVLASTGPERGRLLKRAQALALFTVLYNVLEGLVSIYFGIKDETLALFGFGLDSFVEVVSAMGILHMVGNMQREGRGGSGGEVAEARRRLYERRALRITGSAFYVLAAGLAATAALNIASGHRPETAFWGVIVASVSIATMWALLALKMDIGRRLGSPAIVADANCTRACMYLSIALLVSSAGYELTGAGWLDSAGAAYIAFYSLREGREAFEKAKGEGGKRGGGAARCGGGESCN